MSTVGFRPPAKPNFTVVTLTTPPLRLIAENPGTGVQDLFADLARRLGTEGIQPLIIPTSPQRVIRRTARGHSARSADADRVRRRAVARPIPVGRDLPTARLSVASAARTDTARNEGVPSLFVVTNGAADVDGDQQLDLGQAILHGMSRVINNECPNIPLSGD